MRNCIEDGTQTLTFIQVALMTFSGSSHHKYGHYLWEMIRDLEFRSPSTFKTVFLRNWPVNPSGLPGHGQGGDLLQEHNNLGLEQGINKNNQDYDSHYVRSTLSPNLDPMRRHKKEMVSGVGLAPKNGYHVAASHDAELKKLLQLFVEEHVHAFVSGRSYDVDGTERDVDDYARGLDKLGLDVSRGKLRKWIDESKWYEGMINDHLPQQQNPTNESSSDLEEDDESLDDDDEQEENEPEASSEDDDNNEAEMHEDTRRQHGSIHVLGKYHLTTEDDEWFAVEDLGYDSGSSEGSGSDVEAEANNGDADDGYNADDVDEDMD
jgi:hypothetical protein